MMKFRHNEDFKIYENRFFYVFVRNPIMWIECRKLQPINLHNNDASAEVTSLLLTFHSTLNLSEEKIHLVKLISKMLEIMKKDLHFRISQNIIDLLNLFCLSYN